MNIKESLSSFAGSSIAGWLLIFVFGGSVLFYMLGSDGLYAAQEARAALITRNMINSGDYFNPHIHGDEALQKPAFFYWLGVLGAKAFGLDEFAVRLPSALAAFLAAVVTCLMAGRIYGRKTGFLAGLMFVSMFSFAQFGRLARIDMTLAALYTWSVYLVYRGYFEERKANWRLYLFYAVLAVSVLTKGPVTVLLAGLTILLFCWREGNWRILWELKPVSGLFIGLLITMPCFIYTSIQTQGEFAKDFFLYQNIERFFNVQGTYAEGKRKALYFYVPYFFIGALPWSALIPFMFWSFRSQLAESGKMLFGGRVRELFSYFRRQWLSLRPETCFLILWILVVFVFFSLAAFKRKDYILPLFPPMAMLLARYLETLKGTSGKLIYKYWHGLIACLALLASAGITLVIIGSPQAIINRAASGSLSFINAKDAFNIINFCNAVAEYWWLFALGAALFLSLLWLAGKLFERKHFFAGVCAVAALLILGQLSYVSWGAAYSDPLNSLKAFSIASGKHVKPGEKVAFHRLWNLEAAFFLNCPYDNAWRDAELSKQASRNGILKMDYDYLMMPVSDYEETNDEFRKALIVLEETPPDHLSPTIFCKIAKEEKGEHGDPLRIFRKRPVPLSLEGSSGNGECTEFVFDKPGSFNIIGRVEFEVSDPDAYGKFLVLEKTPSAENWTLNGIRVPIPLGGMDYKTLCGIPASALKKGHNVLELHYSVRVVEEHGRLWPDKISLNATLREQVAADFAFQTGPIAGAFSKDSFSVSCRTSLPSKVEMQIGDRMLKSEIPSYFHQFRTDGLSPGQEYSYTLRASSPETGESISTGPFVVRTLPDSGKLVFAAAGDGRENVPVWSRVAELILAAKPSFLLDTGDLVTDGFNDFEWNDWFWSPAQTLLASVPFYLCPGDHESGRHTMYYPEGVPLYMKLFILPHRGRFRAWSQELGPVLIIGVDSQNEWWWNKGGETLFPWLEGVLKNSKAKFIFLLAHEPPWTSTRRGGSKAMQEVFELLSRYQGTAMLSADAHSYERIEPDGKTSAIITAGAGAPLRGLKNKADESKIFLREYNYLIFKIDGDTCTMSAYALGDEKSFSPSAEPRLIDTRSWSARQISP